MIHTNRFIQWMNVVREAPDSERFRVLENFWASQINSKMLLIKTVQQHCTISKNSNIYIFGGWYGILAQLLFDVFPNTNIFSIDKDYVCEEYGKKLILDTDNIHFITDDMTNQIVYNKNTSLIINTSTEHISQNTFNKWYSYIPPEISIVLQGNNYFECEEHIRCAVSLEDFKKLNKLNNYMYEGELTCPKLHGTFLRFMTIGKK